MSVGGVRAGKAFVEVGVKDNLKSGLSRLKRQLKAFAIGAAKMGAVAGAAIAGFTAIAIKKFADFGDMLNKMSARTGLAVESLSQLKFAAEQSGAGINDIEKAVKRMSAAIYDATNGSKESVDALAQLGLTADQLNRMAPEEQFEAIAKALARIEGASKRAALAQKLFGRSGTQLLPMLGNMDKLTEQADRLGLTMSTEAAQAAADITDAVNTIQSAWKGMFTTVLSMNSTFLTAMAKMTEVFARNIQRIMGATTHGIGMALLKRAAAFGKIFGFTAPGLDNAINGATAGSRALGSGDLSRVFGELAGALNPLGGGDNKLPFQDPGATGPGTLESYKKGEIDAFSAMAAGFKPREAMASSFSMSTSAVGGFVGGAGIGQGARWEVKINEDQLSEARRTNDILEEMKRMATLNGGGGAPWLGGI